MTQLRNRASWRFAFLPLVFVGLVTACGASPDDVADTTADTTDEEIASTIAAEQTSTGTGQTTVAADVESTDEVPVSADTSEPASQVTSSTFVIEVWADNWSAVYVNGALIGEDSVPITTERSFNAETFTFDATYPFTIAIEAKDFKETDSGIEYIGEQNQQMGDGGIIAQITDTSTGETVAGTDSEWKALVVHQAPLNTDCELDAEPDETCEFLILETPADWASADFDDSDWTNATVWSAADVDPKDGYNEITWDPSAQLIWGTDLEVDNTVLLRTAIS
ncbi:PEBP family protein [Ilumatobacter sp.]|uniref:PEBP family protein n=1 Tax=Ilumatobacter sp. TaxID=1967498 RepID=UPI003C4F9C59